MGSSNAVAIIILEPRFAKSIAPTFCISLHMRTQSPHSMHLCVSLTMHTLEVSSLGSGLRFLKRMLSMPNREASSCSLHLPFFWQVVQSRQWLASSSSSIILRCLCSLSVLVYISMPALGTVEQAASIPPWLFSTMHMRHAP